MRDGKLVEMIEQLRAELKYADAVIVQMRRELMTLQTKLVECQQSKITDEMVERIVSDIKAGK